MSDLTDYSNSVMSDLSRLLRCLLSEVERVSGSIMDCQLVWEILAVSEAGGDLTDVEA